MVETHPIVAVGLLSARDLERLGSGFELAYPVAGDHAFEDLLMALDRMEWPHHRIEDPKKGTGQD